MPPHKIYVDSRASKEGTPSSFTWSPDRPLFVEKCRAFIDSVHMANSFGTIHSGNRHLYVTEQLASLTVLSTANRLYITEDGVSRIVTIPAAAYSGAQLATALQTALTAGGLTYTCAWTSNASLGSIALTSSATAFTIHSRKSLQSLTSFAGSAITPTTLADASDILGTLTQDLASTPQNGNPGSLGTLVLGYGLVYRKISLDIGVYTFDAMKTELKTKLDSGTSLSAYTVDTNEAQGKLQITNAAALKFHIWPEGYLDANPYSFQGYAAPFQSCDDAAGFTGTAVLEGNTILAASMYNSMAFHTLFISSSLGTHNDSIGPVSQSTIARKVVIDQPYGGFIHDFHGLGHDYVILEKQAISALNFRVTDWRGHTVDMQHWSLSIILIPESEF